MNKLHSVSLKKIIEGLRLPVIVAPMFSVSTPELIEAACSQNIGAAFPAASAKSIEALRGWMKRLSQNLTDDQGGIVGFWGISVVSHKTNHRLESEIELISEFKPPFVVSALGAPSSLIEVVHSYGGLIFSDVTTIKHAKKAAYSGVDGIILICAGSGGHTGTLSPFAFVDAVREFWNGTLILAGGISSGRMIKAALTLGVDAVYIGSYFISANESGASLEYRDAIISANADDVEMSDKLSGVRANFLKGSIDLIRSDLSLVTNPTNDFYRDFKSKKLWFDLYSTGHGVGKVVGNKSMVQLIDDLDFNFQS